MTTDLARIPFTWDGDDFQLADLSIFLEITRGLNETPRVRGVDVTVPGLAGRSGRNRRNDTLSILLEGQITADPAETDPDDAAASYRTKLRLVRAAFASNRARGELIAFLEDGDTASISALPLNIVPSDEIPGAYMKLSIELEGYDDWVFETPGS